MKSFVNLRICGNSLDFNMISKCLGINYDYSYKEGEPIINKKTNKTFGQYSEDCWSYGLESMCDETPEMCLNRFLTKISFNSEYLKCLSQKYNVTIWISIYPDDEQNNLHISNDILKEFYNMGISLDISTLFLKSLY